MRFVMLTLVGILIFPNVFASVLDPGSLQSGKLVTDNNVYSLSITDPLFKKMLTYLVNHNDGVESYILISSTSRIYAVSSAPALYVFDSGSADFVSSARLLPWRYQFYSSSLAAEYTEIGDKSGGSGVMSGGVAPGPGCIGDKALRYGDIDGDGKPDLVIYFGSEFMIYSLDYGRIVFSADFDSSDWFTKSEQTEYFSDDSSPLPYQYMSRMLANNQYQGPGLRIYSKIYMGDFDKDGNPDILLWEKGYKSNKASDSQSGFTKVEEHWIHYERDLKAQAASSQGVTGEYLPQSTSEAVIRGWLASNSLTWSSGYPDKSECSGQEGQPIPEMHDPLLNDPDVLK